MQTIRIDTDDHRALKELSAKTNKTMAQLLSDAIAALRRQLILEATNDGYRALREDESAWKDEQALGQDWDQATVADADPDDSK